MPYAPPVAHKEPLVVHHYVGRPNYGGRGHLGPSGLSSLVDLKIKRRATSYIGIRARREPWEIVRFFFKRLPAMADTGDALGAETGAGGALLVTEVDPTTPAASRQLFPE